MYRNIPVVSWLLQRGRAHCCGARIPAWYVIAEAGAVVAALVGAWVSWPHPWWGGLVGTAAAMATLWGWHRQRNHAPGR